MKPRPRGTQIYPPVSCSEAGTVDERSSRRILSTRSGRCPTRESALERIQQCVGRNRYTAIALVEPVLAFRKVEPPIVKTVHTAKYF